MATDTEIILRVKYFNQGFPFVITSQGSTDINGGNLHQCYTSDGYGLSGRNLRNIVFTFRIHGSLILDPEWRYRVQQEKEEIGREGEKGTQLSLLDSFF